MEKVIEIKPNAVVRFYHHEKKKDQGKDHLEKLYKLHLMAM